MICKASTRESDAFVWIRSSYSDHSDPGDCIEVAAAPRTVHVRDSKNPSGPHLTVTRRTWVTFLSYAQQR
ncbi:DUF397 domain-containing protein [Streptomyces sp. CC210A]|uniref:DUF397 domain-containing protein n=1 Tax=Streptomyces sp. CC210A TaxID=2898184 RepID=UPI001F31F189|nr:DUF397 domain-containing protein [Streptomyces sp. CC210A]